MKKPERETSFIDQLKAIPSHWRYFGIIILFFCIGGGSVWLTEHNRTQAITADVVNMRKGPGISYDIDSQLKKGTSYRIVSTQNGWQKILLNDGRVGWLAGWLSDSIQAMHTENSVGTGYLATLLTDAPAYESAEDNANKIADVKKDDKYNIIFQQNGWVQVQLDSELAWIKQENIEITPGNVPAPALNDAIDSSADTKFLKDYDYKVIVEAEGAHIRQSPDTSSPIIYEAHRKEPLAYIGQSGAYYHVKTADGDTGYIANWVVTSDSQAMKQLAETAKATTTLQSKTIVLDPGHGGEDPGTISDDESLYEKDITLKTAQAVKAALEGAGATVIMTRDDDETVSLAERPALANQQAADAFISLHYDKAENNPSASGSTVYQYGDTSTPLALAVQSQLVEKGQLPNTGIKFGDFQVLRESQMPGLLIELGYMSNLNDIAVFIQDSYYDHVAQSIVDGLTIFFNTEMDQLLNQLDPENPSSEVGALEPDPNEIQTYPNNQGEEP
ncbi:MAG: N-acetylmuramoyl-L-alanine amidase [Aerococcus sp.]|nr:N-acetylmuramoyl-L-alanine amidase [Aerococcus sp.]